MKIETTETVTLNVRLTKEEVNSLINGFFINAPIGLQADDKDIFINICMNQEVQVEANKE